MCVYVASFETFGSGSFGGPHVNLNPTGSHSGSLGGPLEGGGSEGPPAREASVPATQGPRRRAA